MTLSHSTDCPRSCPDPFRWTRDQIAAAWDDFADPEHPSQRQYAQQHQIPRSTLGAWLRDDRLDDSDLDPELVAFFRSGAGQRFLRRLVLALFTVFVFGGAAGLRLLGRFLRLCQLDRFVASSYGALHTLAKQLEKDLVAFAAEQRPRLAQQMPRRTIALVPDENFHGPHPCLVAIEPVSNFILVECYRKHRDGDTWTTAIQEGVRDLPVEVVLLTSDRASGLLRCARDGLEVPHSPDLFHGQRDLLKGILLPLQRPIQQAHKELEHARGELHRLQAEEQAAPPEQRASISVEEFAYIAGLLRQEQSAQRKLQQASEPKEQVLAQVRGLADDYHPFDRHSGRPVEATEMAPRLQQRLDRIEQVLEAGSLTLKGREALSKGRTWVVSLVAVVGWFWTVARTRVEELALSEEAERQVYECLLPGVYWQAAADRARTPDERDRLGRLAERLQEQAWQTGGALAGLPEEERRQVEQVARETAGLFSRSSSCVEGRNGRLALHHHGQGRLSEQKLKALTVIHNYLLKRADGTTAAERFFGARPTDLFGWLLQRLPDLPRPAARRPPKATPTTPRAG